MKSIIYLALALAVAAASAGRANAEIASDLNTEHRTYLYYLDGDDIVRAQCDADAVAYDHDTCKSKTRHAPAHRVFAASAVTYGGDLPDLQKKFGQARTGIERVDTRLQELLNTPTADTQALRDAIDRLTRQIADASVKTHNLADQVARLNEAIAHGDTVAEDQLRITGAAYASAVKAEAALQDQLQLARKAYIDAASANTDSTFQGLLRDRERLARVFADTKYDLDNEVQESVNLATLYTRLSDTGFVYTHLLTERNYEDTFRVLCGHDFPSCSWQHDSFDALFLGIDKELRTFAGTPSADKHVVTTVVNRDDAIEQMECSFDVETVFGETCDPKMRVRGPRGYDVSVDANSTAGYYFRAQPWAAYGNVSNELWYSLIAAPSLGTWSVEFFCASGARRTVKAASCQTIVNHRELWGNFCSQMVPAPCNDLPHRP